MCKIFIKEKEKDFKMYNVIDSNTLPGGCPNFPVCRDYTAQPHSCRACQGFDLNVQGKV